MERAHSAHQNDLRPKRFGKIEVNVIMEEKEEAKKGLKRVTCRKCDMIFANMDNLKRHVNNKVCKGKPGEVIGRNSSSSICIC